MSYSFPEEMKRGSLIGNIAKDLGLPKGALSTRRARIDTEGSDKHYCDINLGNGELIVTERIDREELLVARRLMHLKKRERYGGIHAVRFDYEQFRSFKVHVRPETTVFPPTQQQRPVSVFIWVGKTTSSDTVPCPRGQLFMTEAGPQSCPGGLWCPK
ncbi:hypothetical protein CRENBAI_021519 [Crenichthys baileyi]|uniref:Cadherin N-terminal domain-containing protein n=1 Tax=Crenichthys baileyi TaxID=28760 RepID=A0AAV9QZB8_9TELE